MSKGKKLAIVTAIMTVAFILSSVAAFADCIYPPCITSTTTGTTTNP